MTLLTDLWLFITEAAPLTPMESWIVIGVLFMVAALAVAVIDEIEDRRQAPADPVLIPGTPGGNREKPVAVTVGEPRPLFDPPARLHGILERAKGGRR